MTFRTIVTLNVGVTVLSSVGFREVTESRKPKVDIETLSPQHAVQIIFPFC
jgi:hypothetical protein